jgi:hypothetical protein
MAPQMGKKMRNKPVKRIKPKSKEDQKKKRMRIKKQCEKMKQSKKVPKLLELLDNTCKKNLAEWLLKFPTAVATMSQNKVKFGIIMQTFGMLDRSLTGAMQTRLKQLEQKPKTPAETAEVQGSEAGIPLPHATVVKCNLLLPKEYQCQREWQTLFNFLRDQSLENMGVTHVDRALALLDMGFAKSVDPTMQGDLHERIRDKLLKQREVANAKNKEKADKKKQEQKILDEYKTLSSPINWEIGCRPIVHTGLVVSQDPQVIFGPFSLSASELADLLITAKKDASHTRLKWIHLAVLSLYTGSHYRKLNMLLQNKGNEAEVRKYAHYLVHLTNALNILEKLPQDDSIVYRGTGYFELNIQQEDKLVFQAPTSASKSMCVANGFMKSKGILFVIETLTAASIEKFSLFKHEKEVLCPPNSCFTVKKITRDKGEMAKVLFQLTDDDREDIEIMVLLEQYA